MANILSYIKTIWRAGREGGTAWTPERLNNIENGIEQATNQINQNSADIETINNNVIVELKMLGWNVPSECPIKNEVSDNSFIQKVGRIDLSSLPWVDYYGAYKVSNISSYGIKLPTSDSEAIKGYSKVYKITPNDSSWGENCICVSAIDNAMYCNSSTGTPRGYLYYEALMTKGMSIDGNEIVETINSNLTFKIINNGADYTITRSGNTVIFHFAGIETKTGTIYKDYLTDLNIPKMSAFAPMINVNTGELVYVIMDTYGIITVASNRGIPINDNVNLVGQVCWNV